MSDVQIAITGTVFFLSCYCAVRYFIFHDFDKDHEDWKKRHTRFIEKDSNGNWRIK